MTQASWNADFPTEAQPPEEPWSSPGLLNLRQIRAELRRRRRLWLGLALLGAIAGLLLTLVLLPTKATATSTLFLAHDPATDPSLAMQTDLGLLQTNTVAQQTLTDLGLQMDPELFLKTVTATVASTQLLKVDVTADDAATALARSTALTKAYLVFRSSQLTQQTGAVIAGLNQQMDTLNGQVTTLTAQIDALQSSTSPAEQSRLTDLISQRAALQSQVSQLRQGVESDQLTLAGIVGASHLIDPATVLPPHKTRRLVLNVATGLVAGLAVGLGIVVVGALVSDRPRRRAEISDAVGAPVTVSTGRIRGWWRSRREHRAVMAVQLADALEPRLTGHARVAMLGSDNGADLTTAAEALARALAARGSKVLAIDLTEKGGVQRRLERETGRLEHLLHRGSSEGQQEAELRVKALRPSRVPTRAEPPTGVDIADPHAAEEGRARFSGQPDVTMVVAEVDLAIGADHVSALADHAFLLLTAGAASAELLGSVAAVVRASGLTVDFVALVGSDSSDESLGVHEPTTAADAPQRSGGATQRNGGVP